MVKLGILYVVGWLGAVLLLTGVARLASLDVTNVRPWERGLARTRVDQRVAPQEFSCMGDVVSPGAHKVLVRDCYLDLKDTVSAIAGPSSGLQFAYLRPALDRGQFMGRRYVALPGHPRDLSQRQSGSTLEPGLIAIDGVGRFVRYPSDGVYNEAGLAVELFLFQAEPISAPRWPTPQNTAATKSESVKAGDRPIVEILAALACLFAAAAEIRWNRHVGPSRPLAAAVDTKEAGEWRVVYVGWAEIWSRRGTSVIVRALRLFVWACAGAFLLLYILVLFGPGGPQLLVAFELAVTSAVLAFVGGVRRSLVRTVVLGSAAAISVLVACLACSVVLVFTASSRLSGLVISAGLAVIVTWVAYVARHYERAAHIEGRAAVSNVLFDAERWCLNLFLLIFSRSLLVVSYVLRVIDSNVLRSSVTHFVSCRFQRLMVQCDIWRRRLIASERGYERSRVGRHVLYLRSFDDDGALIAGRGGHDTPLTTFEEELLAWVGASGAALIAIGKPGEFWPQAGASREYVNGEEWRAAVADRTASAAAIVLLVGSTPNLAWEFNLVVASDALQRATLVFPNVAEAERRERLSALCSRLDDRHLAATLVAAYTPNTLAIGFGEGGVPIVYQAFSSRPPYYQRAMALAIPRTQSVRGPVPCERTVARWLVAVESHFARADAAGCRYLAFPERIVTWLWNGRPSFGLLLTLVVACQLFLVDVIADASSAPIHLFVALVGDGSTEVYLSAAQWLARMTVAGLILTLLLSAWRRARYYPRMGRVAARLCLVIATLTYVVGLLPLITLSLASPK